MRARSYLLTLNELSASTALARAEFPDCPERGEMNSLELIFTNIAGGATAVSKLTLSWVDADFRYLANAETTGLTINLDAADATRGSYELNVGKEFNGTPPDATGLYLGVQLDAGTATVNAYLNIMDLG